MKARPDRMMVGREYVLALRRRAGVVVGLAIVAAVAAFGVAERLPEQHEVHFSYVVSLVEREVHDEFRFDGYYALQATDLFAATLARWVSAPEVVAAAYEEAGLLVRQQSGQQLTRTVKAEKTAPQLVQVTVRAEQREKAQALAGALRSVVEERVAHYHEQGIPELEFRAVAGEQWIGVVTTKAYLVAIAAGGLVLLLGVNVVALGVAVRQGQEYENRD